MILLLASGALLVDWRLVRLAFAREWKAPKGIAAVVEAVAFPIAVSGGAIWLMVEIFEMLGLGWLLLLLWGVVSGISVSVVVGSPLMRYVRDWRRLERIGIRDRMTRSDIASALDSLTHPDVRLDLVRKLAQNKVIATGSWPNTFHLTTSSDAAKTELAKLEERWLRLDR